MASRRMIDPSFWQSDTVGSLTLRQRLLFIGIFSNADDQGRLRAHPAILKAQVFVYDLDILPSDVEADLKELVNHECITVYQDSGRPYIQVLNWWKYQQPRWAWPSKIPAPEGWTDRLHYRRGNDVVSVNWEGSGGMVAGSPSGDTEGDAETDGDDSGAIVDPPRTHSETIAGSAPRDRDSTSTSTSDSNSGSIPGVADATAPTAPPSPVTFQEWQELVKVSTNRPATLRFMFAILYPGLDPPDFGYIGKTAKAVGGAGRLAELLWQFSTRPPTGDVLAYIQAGAKRAKERAGPDEPAGWAGLREWLGMQDGEQPGQEAAA